MKNWTPENLNAAIDAVMAGGTSSQREAARYGIPRRTLDRHVGIERQRIEAEKPALLTFPEIPADDITTGELIDMMAKRFKARHAAHNARKWMPVKVNIAGPMGICWFGDPRLDDDGCNWPLLQRDIETIKKTPGMVAANIGDSVNNWVGGLAREYAHQETSKRGGWRLTKWLLQDSGMDWLLWLIGNHDAWNDGTQIMKEMNVNAIPMEDWRAQFKLVFPNGREALIDAAHNHKGHSQFNPLHGQKKAALWDSPAHLFIAGHLHTWALAQEEDAEKGITYWMARARGYKFIDTYAKRHGFPEQQEGAAIVSVFNPDSKTAAGFLQCFADVEAGADYLTWLRSRL